MSEADKKINEIMEKVLARTNAVLGDIGKHYLHVVFYFFLYFYVDFFF